MTAETKHRVSYKPGDVILRSEPFAHVVNEDLLQEVCSWCLRKEGHQKDNGERVISLKKCKGCKMLVYCSTECQREDWVKGFHKKECKLMARVLVAPPTLIRLAARAIFKVRAGCGDTEEDLPNGQNKSYNDLNDSIENHRSITQLSSTVKGKKVLIKLTVKLVLEYMREKPSEELKKLCTSVLCKEHTEITDGLPAGIFENMGIGLGAGFYIGTSIINHSCWPNAVAIFKGKARVIRAIDNIKSFNEVRISYVDVDLPLSVRKEELWKDWKIDCKCDECNMVNPGAEERQKLKSPPFRCLKCKRNGRGTIGCWACKALGIPSQETLERQPPLIQKKLKAEIDKILDLALPKGKNASSHANDLPDGIELWSPYILEQFRHALVNAASDYYGVPSRQARNMAARVHRLKWGRPTMLFPKYDPRYALLCLQIQRAEAHLGKQEYAIELWKIAFEIFEVSHGKDHPLLFKISKEESHEDGLKIGEND